MDAYKLTLFAVLIITGGYVEVKLDCWVTCLEPLEENVIENSKNATVMEGCNVTLRCVFKTNYHNCVWYRSNSTVTIRMRYRYFNTMANGTNTNDCSMIITKFETIDAAEWKCSTTHDSDSSPNTMSRKAYLKMSKSNNTGNCDSLGYADESERLTDKSFKNNILLLTLITSLVLLIIAVIITSSSRKRTSADRTTCIIAASCCGNCGANQCDQIIAIGEIKDN